MPWPREFSNDAIEILISWEEDGDTRLETLDRLWELAERDTTGHLCEALNCKENAILCFDHSQ